MSDRVSVEMLGRFEVIAPSLAELDDHTDKLMDALLALEDDNLQDSTIGVNLSEGIVEIEIVSIADSFDEAVEQGDAAVRAAIHAAGGSTPGWRAVAKHAQLAGA